MASAYKKGGAKRAWKTAGKQLRAPKRIERALKKTSGGGDLMMSGIKQGDKAEQLEAVARDLKEINPEMSRVYKGVAKHVKSMAKSDLKSGHAMHTHHQKIQKLKDTSK